MTAVSGGRRVPADRALALGLVASSVLAVQWAGTTGVQAETRSGLRVEAQGGFDRDGEAALGELLVQPSLEWRGEWNGRSCDALLEPRLRMDIVDELMPGRTSLSNYSTASRPLQIGERGELELREAWLRCALGRSTVTVGRQQIVWGQADGIRVLDLINPQSFREFILDEFEDARIPLWSAVWEMRFGNATALELVFSPDTSRNELPPVDGRFRLVDPTVTQLLAAGSLPVFEPSLDGADDPWTDGVLAARLSTVWRGWDLSWIAAAVSEPFPVVSVRRADGGGLRLQQRSEDLELMGLTTSRSWGDWTLRSEVSWAFDRSFSPSVTGWSTGLQELPLEPEAARADNLRSVVGLDWRASSSWLLSAQWFHDELSGGAAGDADKPAQAGLVAAREEVQSYWTGLVDWRSRSEEHSVRLSWIGAWDGSDLARLRWRWQLDDVHSLVVSADWFDGEAQELFGAFDAQDRWLLGWRLDL